MTDPNNGVTTNTYDSNTHQITRQQEPITTRATTFSYSGGITTITDPKGNVTKEEYINGILLSRSSLDANGNAIAAWTYSFDPAAVGPTGARRPNGGAPDTTRHAKTKVLSQNGRLRRSTPSNPHTLHEPAPIQKR